MRIKFPHSAGIAPLKPELKNSTIIVSQVLQDGTEVEEDRNMNAPFY